MSSRKRPKCHELHVHQGLPLPCLLSVWGGSDRHVDAPGEAIFLTNDENTSTMSDIPKCCLSGHLHEGTPKGKETKLGSMNAYVTGDEKNKARTILYLVDIFGYDLPSTLLLQSMF